MKKTFKSNCIAIIVSIVVTIASFVIGALVWHFFNNRVIVGIVSTVVLASICTIVFSVVAIFRKKRANRTLGQLAYNFNYSQEYEIYKRVGRAKNDGFSRELKDQGIVIPNKYTVWKEGILQRNGSLKNNEDFFHLLKHEVRVVKGLRDCIAVVATPLLIGIMTVFLAYYISKGGNSLLAMMPVMGMQFCLMFQLMKYKTEIAYVEDVIEILCPKYCNAKYNLCESVGHSEDE